MRRLAFAVVAIAVAIGASGCLGVGGSAPKSTCANTPRPNVAMAVRPAAPPDQAAAKCMARSQTAVFGTPAWGQLPKTMLAVNPVIQTWEARSLLYACNSGCDDTVFTASWMEQHHPEWVLHDASGQTVHPVGEPQLVLLDFNSLDYLNLWADRVDSGLGHGGWTGVYVTDAVNDPDWSTVPLDGGKPITPGVQQDYLGNAMQYVRAVVKTNGYRLTANNGPATIINSGQINSTDGVSTGGGFAELTGGAWEQLYDYFYQAFVRRVPPFVWDDRDPELTRAQRVYGLASYLLVQTSLSAYGAGDPLDPLYRVNVGDPNSGAPVQQGRAFVRQFTRGASIVNPSGEPVTVTLSGGITVDVPPFSAIIRAGTSTIRS